MPTSVELCENGHVLFYLFTEPWTVADMVQTADQARAFYDRARWKLHVIVDARGIRSMPPGVLRARNNPDLHHPNSGQIAVIGAPRIVQIMGETVLRLTRVDRARFFETEDEAWRYLRQIIAEEEAVPF